MLDEGTVKGNDTPMLPVTKMMDASNFFFRNKG